MNPTLRRALVPLVCAALLAAFVAGLLIARQLARPAVHVVWTATGGGFSSQDEQTLIARVQAAAAAQNGSAAAAITYAIDFAQRSGDQAILGIDALDSAGRPLASEPGLMLAQRSGSDWQVWTASSPGFCAELGRISADLLTADDKTRFMGCAP